MHMCFSFVKACDVSYMVRNGSTGCYIYGFATLRGSVGLCHLVSEPHLIWSMGYESWFSAEDVQFKRVGKDASHIS